MPPAVRGLRALVSMASAETPNAAPASDHSRLLNIDEARALVPKRPDGKPWSDAWMRTRCAPKAKVRFGGRVYWREAGLTRWIADLGRELP